MLNESNYQFIDSEERAQSFLAYEKLECGNVPYVNVDLDLLEFALKGTRFSCLIKKIQPEFKDNLIDHLDELYPETTLSTFQKQSLSVILDELITNASIHGKMALVEIKFYLNEKRDIFVSVEDQQGRLPLKEVLKLLDPREASQVEVRGRESKGAGVGLFFCKEFSSGILFEVVKNEMTRISCVVPRRPAKSLNHPVLIQFA